MADTVRHHVDTVAADDRGALFSAAHAWADMDEWHRRVAEVRWAEPVLPVDGPGFAPFWVLTRHADMLAVSRDNTTWENIERSVLGPDEDWEQLVASGMPVPASLAHLDGTKHRQHRAVTSDWFKPAAVRHPGHRRAPT